MSSSPSFDLCSRAPARQHGIVAKSADYLQKDRDLRGSHLQRHSASCAVSQPSLCGPIYMSWPQRGREESVISHAWSSSIQNMCAFDRTWMYSSSSGWTAVSGIVCRLGRGCYLETRGARTEISNPIVKNVQDETMYGAVGLGSVPQHEHEAIVHALK